MAPSVPTLILTTPSPTKRTQPLSVPAAAYPVPTGTKALKFPMSTPSPGTSPASPTTSVLPTPTSAASSVSVPEELRFENYSSLCSLCHILRRELKKSAQDPLSSAVAQKGPIDIGHWDDYGHTTPSHKHKWGGRLRTAINARSEKIKGTGVMSSAAAAQSFASLEEVVSIFECEEDGVDPDGGKVPELPKCIHDGEPGTAEHAKVSGIMHEETEFTGLIPIPLDPYTGVGNVHDDKCGVTPRLETGAGESEAEGEGLSADEQRRIEELEGGSGMVFFGEFPEGEEWASVPLAIQE